MHDLYTDPLDKIYPGGGGTDLYCMTLRFFWQEWRAGRNKWSKSNEGYDLAKYRGTYLKLYQHPTLDYIFWYDRDEKKIVDEHLNFLFPATLMMQRNTIIVPSRTRTRRVKHKKIFIKPPSTFTNTWDFMSNWCTKTLFIYGVSIIDLDNSFVTERSPNEITLHMPWRKLEPTSDSTYPTDWDQKNKWADENDTYYYQGDPYHWLKDTGYGNQFQLCEQDKTATYNKGTFNKPPTHITGPYDTMGQTYGNYFWGHAENDYDCIEDSRQSKKGEKYKATHIMFNWLVTKYHKSTKKAEEHTRGWTNYWLPLHRETNNTQTWIDQIIQAGPYVTDIEKMPNSFSFALQYKSLWTWGGFTPGDPGPIVKNPCVTDPAIVTSSNLRLGDLDRDGFIKDPKYTLLTALLSQKGRSETEKIYRRFLQKSSGEGTWGSRRFLRSSPREEKSMPSSESEQETQESSSGEETDIEREEEARMARQLKRVLKRRRELREFIRKRLKQE